MNLENVPRCCICEECGRKVFLVDGLDNFCDCGLCYNLFGQSVLPSTDPAVEESLEPDEWDEWDEWF